MGLPDQALWREMLRYLRKNHVDICRQWFEELEPLSLSGGLLAVRARTAVQRRYLEQRCTAEFTDAAQSATGALVGVQFVHGDEAPPLTVTIRPESREVFESEAYTQHRERRLAAAHAGRAGHASPDTSSSVAVADPVDTHEAVDPPSFDDDFDAPEPAPQPRRGPAPRPVSQPPRRGWIGEDDQIVLSPDYTFDNFVTGPGNRLAFAASKAVADKPGVVYNPLFIHGGVGLGKTHLLQAICQTLLEANPEINICYLSCDTFMNLFLDSVQNGQMSGFRNRYRHVDLLLIDDIHFLAKRDRAQEEFFHTFNTLYQAGHQIVLSSDSPPEEIPELEERLVSRFKCGLVTRVDKPCYDTRVAIVKKKAAMRGIRIPDDAVCHIAAKLESNIRELEGAINRVQYFAEQSGLAISLDVVRQALGETEQVSAPQLTIQHIIDAVTAFFDVKLSDLQSKRRHRSITVPRQVCMYLARKHTRYSLEEIGGYFGGRDHTTVMHALKIVDDRIKTDRTFASQVDQIDKKLGINGVN